MNRAYCLIMAGGEGKRFWPKGKKGELKQFFPIKGKSSMLEVAFERMRSFVPLKRIFIVTNKKQAVLVRKKMPFLRQDAFILEPFSRNTAAAIGLAALHLRLKDRLAVMLVSPCDHIIKNNKKFLEAANLAVKTAASGNLLVTIGIEPTHPNVEYGYIKLRKPRTNPSPKDKPTGQGGMVRGRQNKKNQIFKVEEFTEKPDRKTAEKFLKSGRYLWNSGIFAWKAQAILDAIAGYMPGLFGALLKINHSLGLPGEEEVLTKAYKRLKNVPIDSGVMEKAGNVVSLKAGFGWDDLGHWEDAGKYAKDFRVRSGAEKNRPGSKR